MDKPCVLFFVLFYNDDNLLPNLFGFIFYT